MDTKSQILDAAEELFGRHGYEGTSLRSLTTAAGVNLAAVHYHFGSKEGLLRGLLERRMNPVNDARLERLDRAEADAAAIGTDPVGVESIVDAFVAPVLEADHGDPKFSNFMRLIGRFFLESSDVVEGILRELMPAVVHRFITALERAIPHVPREEIFWRMHFGFGAFAHALTDCDKIEVVSGGLCDSTDRQKLRLRIVDFMSAGLRSPFPPRIAGSTSVRMPRVWSESVDGPADAHSSSHPDSAGSSVEGRPADPSQQQPKES